MKLYVYIWKGTSIEGDFLEGEIRSPNAYLAKAQLFDLNILITSIRKKILFFRLKLILARQVRIQITEQLSDLLTSGVPITRALTIIEKTLSNPRIKTLLWLIRNYLESGQSFGKTLDLFPRQFSQTYRQLVQIGETSGQLEKVLSRLSSLEKKTILIEGKIKKASFYPCLVFFLATLIFSFLLLEIIPKFSEIFDQAKLALPNTTVLLINASKFLITHGIIIFLILTSFFMGLISLFKTSMNTKKLIWKCFFSLPWIGKALQSFYISQFTYSLSIILQMGINLTKAVEMFETHIKNPLYREALASIHHLIEKGESLSEALKTSFLFPEQMIYTLKIGEESGLMSESLLKIANFHEAIIDQFLDAMSLFLEPVLMIILGLIIGFFIIALYLPIFSLGNAI